jgi:hypothetical protein
VSVTTASQEFTCYDDKGKLAIFRLDFVATILTDTGERKKVLIARENFTDDGGVINVQISLTQ